MELALQNGALAQASIDSLSDALCKIPDAGRKVALVSQMDQLQRSSVQLISRLARFGDGPPPIPC